MGFSLNGLINTGSYNNLVQYGLSGGGGPGLPTSGLAINYFFNVGYGPYGFGQPNPLTVVAAGDSITSAQWTSAISRISLMANHMGISSQLKPTDPTTVNDVIKYDIDYYNNLTPLNDNLFSAVAQGTPTSITGTCTSTWKQQCYFDHVITFPTADQARYFFNAGGQLKMTYSSPVGTTNKIDYLMNQLALDVGTVVISGMGTNVPLPNGVKIAGTTYTGITQIANRFTNTYIDRDLGYYRFPSSAVSNFNNLNTLALTQTSRLGLSTYLDTNLKVRIMSNGTQGSNNDNGNIITIRSIFDEVPDGGAGDSTVSAGTTATCTIVPPSTTYLTNSWGTPTTTVSFVAT